MTWNTLKWLVIWYNFVSKDLNLRLVVSWLAIWLVTLTLRHNLNFYRMFWHLTWSGLEWLITWLGLVLYRQEWLDVSELTWDLTWESLKLLVIYLWFAITSFAMRLGLVLNELKPDFVLSWVICALTWPCLDWIKT